MDNKFNFLNTTIICADCKCTHKCGIECKSWHCLDAQCDCTATEIVPGVYRCDMCNLVVCRDDRGFRQYLTEMTKWYDAFCSRNELYLYRLQQKILSKDHVTDQEREIYKAIDAFCHARRYFPVEESQFNYLDTISHRRSAYILIKAFEKIKKIQI